MPHAQIDPVTRNADLIIDDANLRGLEPLLQTFEHDFRRCLVRVKLEAELAESPRSNRLLTTSSAACFSATNRMVLPAARPLATILAIVWDLPGLAAPE